MKVIPFPGAQELHKKIKKQKIKVESLPSEGSDRIHLSNIGFTCPNCYNKAKIDIEGIIFKTLEFYCSKCGTKHKVSNPAFSVNQNINQKKQN